MKRFHPWAAVLTTLSAVAMAAATTGAAASLNASAVAAACPGVFARGAVLTRVADATFGEGPLDFPEAHATLFTDWAHWAPTPPKVFLYERDSGAVRLWMRNASVNGMARMPNGDVALAPRANRSVGVMANPGVAAKAVVTVATAYQGRRLNAPNDLVVDDGGGIFFTDPTWGVEEVDRELDFKGVYYLPPGGGNDDLQLIATQTWPNGLGLLPDGRLLVANEQEPLGWYLYTRQAGAASGWTRALITVPPLRPLLAHRGELAPAADRRGNDGMHVDASGDGVTVYATGYGGLYVMQPADGAGRWPVQCVLPPPPSVTTLTNVVTGACGGSTAGGGCAPAAPRRCVYVTAEDGLYKIPLA